MSASVAQQFLANPFLLHAQARVSATVPMDNKLDFFVHHINYNFFDQQSE